MNLRCFLLIEILAIASTSILPVPIADEEKKTNLNFYFNATFWREGLTAYNHPFTSCAKFLEKLILLTY